MCAYMQKMELRYWWEYGDEKERRNKLNENRTLIPCSRVLRFSELPKCRERPQTAICSSEWLTRYKCLATGLDASFSLLSTS